MAGGILTNLPVVQKSERALLDEIIAAIAARIKEIIGLLLRLHYTLNPRRVETLVEFGTRNSTAAYIFDGTRYSIVC